jgi:hypothetical protein
VIAASKNARRHCRAQAAHLAATPTSAASPSSQNYLGYQSPQGFTGGGAERPDELLVHMTEAMAGFVSTGPFEACTARRMHCPSQSALVVTTIIIIIIVVFVGSGSYHRRLLSARALPST